MSYWTTNSTLRLTARPWGVEFDTPRNHVVTYRFGAAQRQREIVFLRTDVVGVTDNLHVDGRHFLEQPYNPRKPLSNILAYVAAIEVEVEVGDGLLQSQIELVSALPLADRCERLARDEFAFERLGEQLPADIR